MSGSSPSLRELIDIDELQSIQDSFARAVGISSVILSPEGEPLTKFTNPTGFCALIQSTEKGKERCFQSFMEMGKNALESKEPEMCYCFAHGGHFVAPILIDGEYKGTMFAGQFIPEKFSSEQLHDLEEIAPEIELDQRTLVKEAEKMRVAGEDVVWNYSSLLFKIVEIIARRGAQAAELSRVNDALQRAHDGLERRVQERTAELAEANKGLEQEVAERKLAEGALQKERDRAQHYLDVAGVMLLVIGADRKVTLINKKGCEILGYEGEEEIIGKDWFDNFVPERLRDEVAAVFNSLIAGEIEPVEYYENPVLTKHGEEKIVAWHNTLLSGEQGRVYATMASGDDITERKRIEKALNDRVCFEKIVASISTRFINLAPDEVDLGIEDALRSIGEFSGVDRSYLFRLSDDGTKTDITHEWCARGIVPQIENLKGLSVADFPWFLERLNRFETVHIPSVADLPPGADAEKEILQSQDVLSSILVPTVYGGTLVGFIGFDSVRQEKSWSEENIALLRIICEIFVNALERKRVMDAIQSSETKFHAIFEKNPLGAAIIDKERKIREVNDAAVALIGRPREEIIGMTCHEFICPRAAKECPIYDHGRTIDHTEGIIRSKDHGEIPIEKTATQITIDGEPVILEMFYDITRRKAAEKAITESEEKLRMITASANDAILMMDHEGKISYWNKAAERMFDYTDEEVTGKDLHALLVPEIFHAAFSKGFEGFKKTGQGDALGKTLEVAAIGKDGTEFPVELSLSAVKLKGRWNAIGLIRGIAERKAAEEELKKKSDELEKFNRLAVGRELKMIELKKEINALLGESGKEPGYKIVGAS